MPLGTKLYYHQIVTMHFIKITHGNPKAMFTKYEYF